MLRSRLTLLLARLSKKIRGRSATPAIQQSGSFLAPRWLVSVDQQLVRTDYCVHLSWAGQRSLVATKIPEGKPFYLVLHPNLPFRRKLQRFPPQAKARAALLRAAPDEFPLTDSAAVYCLGLRQNDGYVYALPNEIRQQLNEQGLRSDFMLPGCSETFDAATHLETLLGYERFGSSLSFGGRSPPLQRHWLLDAPLALGAILAVTLTVLLASGADPIANVLESKLERLRRETGSLAKQYAAIESMANTRSQVVQLQANPGANLNEHLARLWSGIPAGHAIRRIEFKDNQLMVSGTGADAGHWLESAGFKPEQITTETVGKLTRFRAETNW